MLRYVRRRLAIGLLTLWAFSILSFVIIELPPGDFISTYYSAVRKYSFADHLFTFIGFLGLAIPNFLLALVLMYVSFLVLGPGKLAVVQGPLRSPSVRTTVGVPNVGTVLFGFLRGVSDGVLGRFDTAYGAMFIASAAIGLAMLAW